MDHISKDELVTAREQTMAELKKAEHIIGVGRMGDHSLVAFNIGCSNAAETIGAILALQELSNDLIKSVADHVGETEFQKIYDAVKQGAVTEVLHNKKSIGKAT